MEPTLNPESGFLRLRVHLAYDGTNYAGWARQNDQRTIQGEIEDALSRITRADISTIVGGRTDAGVHALAQQFHCDIPEGDWDISNFAYRMNRILDPDIRVHWVEQAPENFHARFSALSRSYTYKLMDGGRSPEPLQRFDVATWFRELDVDLLNECQSILIGEHDFAAFCKYREGASTIRTLQRFLWRRDPSGVLIADIKADAFCYSMVRNLVGAVVCVAERRFDLSWLHQLLANKVRVSDSYVFPSKGLTLREIEYPSTPSEFFARAQLTVGRRDDEN